MELFTLGEGHYTEDDVKEAARAFTGWTDAEGRFRFNRRQHDDGEKTVLGVTGRLDGDDVIDILLTQPACARFLATRLLRYFEGVEPDDARIDRYARVLRAGDYDIARFLEHLLEDPDFYRPEVVGGRIAGPIRLPGRDRPAPRDRHPRADRPDRLLPARAAPVPPAQRQGLGRRRELDHDRLAHVARQPGRRARRTRHAGRLPRLRPAGGHLPRRPHGADGRHGAGRRRALEAQRPRAAGRAAAAEGRGARLAAPHPPDRAAAKRRPAARGRGGGRGADLRAPGGAGRRRDRDRAGRLVRFGAGARRASRPSVCWRTRASPNRCCASWRTSSSACPRPTSTEAMHGHPLDRRRLLLFTAGTLGGLGLPLAARRSAVRGASRDEDDAPHLVLIQLRRGQRRPVDGGAPR